MSAPAPSAADVLSVIHAAAVRWVSGLGTAQAAAELGIDPRTVRRKREREGEQGWSDRELAAIIAAELQATGACELVEHLQALVGATPSPVPTRPLDQQVLLLGAGLSEAAAVISRRLADHDLSPRDAGMIGDQLDEIVALARSQRKRLAQVVAAAKRGAL